jgi:putative thiamine transport system ATP-binding protein
LLLINNARIAVAGNTLLAGFSLRIDKGEVVALCGASGTGKSSLLNWVVGALAAPFESDGEICLDDQRVDALPIEARRIGILFQDDLLFPHLSVGENLAFALPASVRGTANRRARVEVVLEECGLAGFHDRDPFTLSGGQRARVALMRTLLSEPRALLLDEPFSRLDLALRAQFRTFVYEHIARLQIPTLLVTHDLSDAPVGGRVINMDATAAPHV